MSIKKVKYTSLLLLILLFIMLLIFRERSIIYVKSDAIKEMFAIESKNTNNQTKDKINGKLYINTNKTTGKNNLEDSIKQNINQANVNHINDLITTNQEQETDILTDILKEKLYSLKRDICSKKNCTEITAKIIQLDLKDDKNNKFTYRYDVKLTQADKEMQSQLMQVFYDGNEITKIDSYLNVELKATNLDAIGTYANYNRMEKSITLRDAKVIYTKDKIVKKRKDQNNILDDNHNNNNNMMEYLLNTDILLLYHDGDKITEAYALEKVDFYYDNNHISGNFALYDAVENKIIVHNAVISSNKDIVTRSKFAEYNLNTEKLKLFDQNPETTESKVDKNQMHNKVMSFSEEGKKQKVHTEIILD